MMCFVFSMDLSIQWLVQAVIESKRRRCFSGRRLLIQF